MNEMSNEERKIIREILMANLEDIPNLAVEAREKHGIKFPEEVADALIYLRIEDREGRTLPVLVEYGYMLCVSKECSWQLGVTAIREAIALFHEAELGLHELTREIGAKILGV